MISESQLNTLEALKVYRYLTTRQIVNMGIYGSEKKLRDRVIARLKQLQLIKSADFGSIAGKGRLPHIHYLTQKGALLLADLHRVSIDDIPYPVKIQFSRDYFHRVKFVDLHIALRRYAQDTGQDLLFFDAYFDTQGNQRQRNSQLIRATQVQLEGKFIVPDGNFSLLMKDGQTRLFSLELHRGNDTKRIIEQLKNHARLIEQDLLPTKYAHPFSNYVLSVYENPQIMRAVQSRVPETPLLSEYSEHFLFNAAETLEGDFSEGWHYFDESEYAHFKT